MGEPDAPACNAAIRRDWHEYECANDHRWWSAPTSHRCPVCGTTTYKPLQFAHGTIAVLTIKDFAA